MASAAQDGEDENYWPGFVDALTTMVMVLTFIMMILGLTVFSLSQNVSKALLNDIAKSADVTTSAQEGATELATKIIAALAEKKKEIDGQPRKAQDPEPTPKPEDRSQREALLVQPGDKETSQAPAQLKALPAGAAAEASEAALTLVFQPNAALIDDPVRRELAVFTARAREGEFVIRAYAVENGGTISEARRLAYYRGMMVRQEFVKAGMKPAQLTVHVDDSADVSNRSVVRVFAVRKTP